MKSKQCVPCKIVAIYHLLRCRLFHSDLIHIKAEAFGQLFTDKLRLCFKDVQQFNRCMSSQNSKGIIPVSMV